MSDIHAVSSLLVETLAGATAGIVSTLAVHPLDVIKTRLQGMSCGCTIYALHFQKPLLTLPGHSQSDLIVAMGHILPHRA